MTEVSVIVPVYGVEKFIARCARSLMEQTRWQSAEFIFVDDASPDSSMRILREVLAEYPDRRVTILTHHANLGLPAARNTGLAAASGEYVMHVDSDDFIEPDTIETMLSAARRDGADFVWADWWLDFGDRRRYMSQPDAKDAAEATRLMLAGAMKYNVWNKLYRRSLHYRCGGISFPAGQSMGEDMTMIMLCAAARQVSYVPKALYHYMKLNSGALTADYSDRRLDELRRNVDRTVGFLTDNFGARFTADIPLFKLSVKYPFLLLSDFRKGYSLWRGWYTEADEAIGRNPYAGRREILVQRWAVNGHRRLLRAYRFMLLKIYYGIIYRQSI